MRMAMFTLVLIGGCSAIPSARECAQSSECNAESEGVCIAAPSGRSWCAYADSTCTLGSRWSASAGEGLAETCFDDSTGSADCGCGADATVDGAVSTPDAATDAGPAQDVFNVGYVSKFRVGTSAASMSTIYWVRVVNMGSAPLDLSTATITDVIASDTRPTVTMTWQPGIDLLLQPGYAAGAISSDATALVNSVVTEPSQDISEGYVLFSMTDLPPAGSWLVNDIEGNLTIGNARAKITVQVQSSGTGSSSTPLEADRVSSMPLP